MAEHGFAAGVGLMFVLFLFNIFNNDPEDGVNSILMKFAYGS